MDLKSINTTFIIEFIIQLGYLFFCLLYYFILSGKLQFLLHISKI